MTAVRTPDTARLTLEELVEEVSRALSSRGLEAQDDARVSPAPDARTIRYYTTLGLLDRPVLVERQARYGRRHVLQLVAIKALQRLALPLAEVQARLYGRSDRELEALADSARGENAPAPVRPRPTVWREMTLEPGLKLLAEESWSPRLSRDDLIARLRDAVAALTNETTRKPPAGGHGGSR